jgi:hypothetical protein
MLRMNLLLQNHRQTHAIGIVEACFGVVTTGSKRLSKQKPGHYVPGFLFGVRSPMTRVVAQIMDSFLYESKACPLKKIHQPHVKNKLCSLGRINP